MTWHFMWNCCWRMLCSSLCKFSWEFWKKLKEVWSKYWNVRTYKEIKFKERWVIRMKIKTNLLFCPSHWLDDPNANSSWSAKGLCSVYWRSAPLAWRCLCPCYKLVLTFQVLWSILVWLLALTSHLQDHFQLPEKIGKIVSFFVFFSYLTRTKQWNNIQIIQISCCQLQFDAFYFVQSNFDFMNLSSFSTSKRF